MQEITFDQNIPINLGLIIFGVIIVMESFGLEPFVKDRWFIFLFFLINTLMARLIIERSKVREYPVSVSNSMIPLIRCVSCVHFDINTLGCFMAWINNLIHVTYVSY